MTTSPSPPSSRPATSPVSLQVRQSPQAEDQLQQWSPLLQPEFRLRPKGPALSPLPVPPSATPPLRSPPDLPHSRALPTLLPAAPTLYSATATPTSLPRRA